MNPFSDYRALRVRARIIRLRPIEAQEKDLFWVGLAMTMIWIEATSTVMLSLLALVSYHTEPGETIGSVVLAVVFLVLLLTVKYHPWYRRAIGIAMDDCD